MKTHIVSLTLCFALCFCTACTQRQNLYRDDISVDALGASLTAVLTERVENGDRAVYLQDESDLLASYLTFGNEVTAHCVIYAQQTDNLDEFGIFYVTDDNTEAVKKQIAKDYLYASYEQNQEWYNSYMPQQTPKLRDAEVRVLGNYVIYCILDSEAKAAIFAKAEEMLLRKN